MSALSDHKIGPKAFLDTSETRYISKIFPSPIAFKVGGVWLEGWITMAAVASQMGLFTAELSSDAYLILGLAEKGMLPKCFGIRSKHGTPTVALLLSCTGVIVMLITFDFVSTVEMLNAVYCCAELLEFAALIWLRKKFPDIQRPFRIPLSIPGLILMLLPSTIVALGVVLAPIVTGDWIMSVFIGGCIITGVALYTFFEYARRHELLRFARMDFEGTTFSYQPFPEEVDSMTLATEMTGSLRTSGESPTNNVEITETCSNS